MSTSSDRDEHYHNKGQSDASKGDYKPPYEPMPVIGDIFGTPSKQDIEDNKSYRAGWRHTKDQKDRK